MRKDQALLTGLRRHDHVEYDKRHFVQGTDHDGCDPVCNHVRLRVYLGVPEKEAPCEASYMSPAEKLDNSEVGSLCRDSTN